MQGARVMKDEDFKEMLKHLEDTPKNIIRQLESSNDGKKALYESHFNNIEQVFCGMAKPILAGIMDVLDAARHNKGRLSTNTADEIFNDLLAAMRMVELSFQGALYAYKIVTPVQMSPQLTKETAKRKTEDFYSLVDDIAHTALSSLERERQGIFQQFFLVKRGCFHVDFTSLEHNEVTVTALLIMGLREDQKKIEQYISTPYELQAEGALSVKLFEDSL